MAERTKKGGGTERRRSGERGGGGRSRRSARPATERPAVPETGEDVARREVIGASEGFIAGKAQDGRPAPTHDFVDGDRMGEERGDIDAGDLDGEPLFRRVDRESGGDPPDDADERDEP